MRQQKLINKTTRDLNISKHNYKNQILITIISRYYFSSFFLFLHILSSGSHCNLSSSVFKGGIVCSSLDVVWGSFIILGMVYFHQLRSNLLHSIKLSYQHMFWSYTSLDDLVGIWLVLPH